MTHGIHFTYERWGTDPDLMCGICSSNETAKELSNYFQRSEQLWGMEMPRIRGPTFISNVAFLNLVSIDTLQ